MTSNEIRERFLSYFEKKGHIRVASSPVIPWGDQTLMFTNAGMNQFKDVFLGREQRDYVRATTCQKCIRAGGKHNDLEEVGRTSRHGTFLEMLGNFSFGDYFKKDAIAFSWEFMTEEMGLNPDLLYVSVYSTDDEAYTIWRDDIGIPEHRILRFGNIEAGDDENFWSMGSTGPCGPCSEIFVDRGPAYGPDDIREDLARDGSRYLELWNLVFMQYNRDESGEMTPLPKPSIDTGLGLERMAMVLQGKDNIFEADILGSLVKRLEEFTGITYEETTGMPFRVAADHVRTLTFAIADGAIPSNEGRGYVLRRILRRASRYIRELNVHEPLIYRIVSDVVDLMGDAYPEITERADYISMVIRSEEERFLKTLDLGVELFDRLVEDMESKGERVIRGKNAFKLYDTYGFPVDLTILMADEKRMTVDMAGFKKEMEIQRVRARDASSFVTREDKGGPWSHFADKHAVGSEFAGYETDDATASLLWYRTGENDMLELVFDRTPFYALSGGQVSDTGTISSRDGSVVLMVKDVYDFHGIGRVHVCELHSGEFSANSLREEAILSIDSEKRRATERNHTSTHLLQAALQKVLGAHVRQSGSFVDSERLRFDFNHFSAMNPEEMKAVEEFVIRNIMENHTVEISSKSLDEARALGAMSLFEEKYGDTVRVVNTGDVSLELCGGTHVSSTGQIGAFRIESESSVAAGMRRIEAVTGMRAYEISRNERGIVQTLSQNLNVLPESIPARIDSLAEKIRELEKEIKRLKTEGVSGNGTDILANAVNVDGVRVAFGRMEAANVEDLKIMADTVRNRIGSGIGVLGADIEGKVSIVVTVTDDLIEKRALKAGTIIKKIAEIVGGSGGGRPHMAMAGGKDVSKLDQALKSAPEVVAQFLKG